MKFGKRRKDADPPADEPAVVAAPEPPPGAVTDTWTVPETPASGPPPTPVPPPAPAPPPSHEAPDAVVEGEAEEIPPEPQVAATFPPAAAFEPPIAFAPPPLPPEPVAVPFPVAEEPVAVVSPGPQADYVMPLGSAAETFASGHGPAPAPAAAWQQNMQELVAERPEVAVGAAFVGGILAAMILRRLGN